ncbi:MAG: DUF433 domain-containing protein [Nitrospira sp.]|nr:DUF433 domain-containing protein [Nitrospira sp.]
MICKEYIVRDATICGGEPVVKGTRVTVRTILAGLKLSAYCTGRS